jgi:hypothetical protein
MRTKGFLPREHAIGDVVWIVTGDEIDEVRRMNGTRCRITTDHGNYEYSWTPAPATDAEILRLIEELDARSAQ